LVQAVFLYSTSVATLRSTIYQYSSFIKASINVCLFCIAAVNSNAQNYFTNTDFEALNNCAELHQDCSSEAWFYVKPAVTPLIYPNVVPKPFSGKDLLILPIENIFKKVSKHPFVYTMLCCPLQKNKKYKLSFYVDTGQNKFLGVDFYFSNLEFTSNNFNADTIQPAIHISQNDIVNSMNGWNFVEKYYIANGNEKFCLLGNFNKKSLENEGKQRMNKAGDVFYFIDDIIFSPVIKEKLCKDYEKNIENLYAQNLRHTEHALVEELPSFIIDTITVPAVFFETDNAILKPAFKKLLDKIIQKFKNYDIANIKIEGHTDNTGTQQRNIILSNDRAKGVLAYFVQKAPYLKDKITAFGKAANFPIADNESLLGRAQNRRVQIILTYTLQKL
jgi:outer membrane protein OmpA-like peptidoglycan-associated protein